MTDEDLRSPSVRGADGRDSLDSRASVVVLASGRDAAAHPGDRNYERIEAALST